VSVNELQRVAPKANDRAAAFTGEYKGKVGVLEGMEEDDGIFKVDDEHLIAAVSQLVKLSSW
jgi:hypothetical protein